VDVVNTVMRFSEGILIPVYLLSLKVDILKQPKWIVSGLCLLHSLFWTMVPVNAQAPTGETCTMTINEAIAQIQLGRRINLDVERIDLSTWATGYPAERPFGLRFAMGGYSRGISADTEAILSSPVMMEAIATRIIEQCPSISYVVFATNNSGWRVPFGVINGSVEGFRCMDEPDHRIRARQSPQWGFYDCSI
jgi:hypothetical protein